MEMSEKVPEDKARFERRLRGGVALGALAVTAVCLFFAFRPDNRMDDIMRARTKPESAVQPVTATAPAPVETPPDPPPVPKSTNCYDNNALSELFKGNRSTRDEFSDEMDNNMQTTGMNLDVEISGDEHESLLILGQPENEGTLRQLAAVIKENPSARANLCVKGFAQIQFILKNSDMSQTLVLKLPTDIGQAANYLQQHAAAPM